MKKRTDNVKTLVSMVFENIPYSPETGEAQDKIETALTNKYDELCNDGSEGEALDELFSKYGRLTQMAELAGYTEDTVLSWRCDGMVKNLKMTKKQFWKQRLMVYTAGIFAVLAFAELFWIFFDANILAVLLMAAINISISALLIRTVLKTERTLREEKYDHASYDYLRSRSDKYTKRLYNSIALLIGSIFIFLGSEVGFYLFGNSKSSELVENFYTNMIMVEIPLFILFKNSILQYIVMHRINLPDYRRAKWYGFGVCVPSVLYWLGIMVYIMIAGDSIKYPANVFIIGAIIFALIVLISNLTVRKRITYRNIVFNGKRVTVAVLALVALLAFMVLTRDTWYTQSFINSVPIVEHNDNDITYDEDSGIYTITKTTDDFKILHLTDIHIGGSLYSYPKDIKALNACYAEIEHTHPDLVVVTGDLCFPLGIMSMSFNNSAPVHQFSAFMRNLGIPWAFTYGNHDTESISTLNKTELNEVYKSLSFKTSGTLLYPYTQPEITGRNNQLIEIRNEDGTLNTALFLIDSNTYTGEGLNVYDYIHDDQVEWYADEVRRLNTREGHTVNSMCFFHIPLQEYKTATELYNEGSSEVKYFFGENPGDHGGITNDLVCCSDYPSKLFDTAVELGSTSAFFCGHDHYNNASLEYRGIRLTYGMSIDYLAQPGIEKETKQRGAELITLHKDGTWDLEQIPLDSIIGNR
ncbi:MAG: metallophosphoesterase [Lachnospiraceae bacterium]|nr:metallophosphoesterase [Lachnospiraceae bacterium]